MIEMMGEEKGWRDEGYGASERDLTYFLLCIIVVCSLPLVYFFFPNLEIQSSFNSLSKLMVQK